ncbi:MAG: hypothetical protein R3B96_15110 [Pirellulaceae bacterium]
MQAGGYHPFLVGTVVSFAAGWLVTVLPTSTNETTQRFFGEATEAEPTV